MPKINVYLPDSLAEAVNDTGVPVSAVCQHALELAVRRVTAVRAAVAYDLDPAGRPWDDPFASLTDRAQSVLRDARQRAQSEGAAEIRTGQLLSGILAEGNNLALRVLRTLDIEPRQLQRELDQRASADRAGSVDQRASANQAGSVSQPPRFGAHAAAALELAVIESTALGNNYIGCEHLLLGLIAEPDGEAGQTLRGLGAKLRVTRRAVAAALAGYYHHVLSQEGSAGADGLAEAVRAEVGRQLAPLVARLDELERHERAPGQS